MNENAKVDAVRAKLECVECQCRSLMNYMHDVSHLIDKDQLLVVVKNFRAEVRCIDDMLVLIADELK